MKKIILLGYMGCGKSTIANELAKRIHIPFVDLDKKIEEKENLSISSIFEKHGEIYFRKLEHQVFTELLNSPEILIIGLGGGTPCYANNHELLKEEGIISIYLRASVDTLFDRLSPNKSKRPLIANKNDSEMKEFIAMHLFERSFYYNHAQYKVTVDSKSIDSVIDDIITILA